MEKFTLTSAVDLFQQAFLAGIQGDALPEDYVSLAQNASGVIEKLRPQGCDFDDTRFVSECTVWKNATREAAKTLAFFGGLRSLGRREVTCEGNVNLTAWEQSNVTGAMMDPKLNQGSLEVAFREIVTSLKHCAPGDGGLGPFFPTSGTLIALLRYGDLVGKLPGNRSDFVDNDLDFFVLMPGDAPHLWQNTFMPCMQIQLGAAIQGKQGWLPSAGHVSKGASWYCRDATNERVLRRPQMPEVSKEDAALLKSDYIQCQRLPPPEETIDLLSQVVVVDIVRVLKMTKDHEFLGGWDRGVRLPLSLLLPASSCRMQGMTVPCPSKGPELLKARFEYYTFESPSCFAVPEVTADRCSYHPDNVQLLNTGVKQDDLLALESIALDLEQAGYASFIEEFRAGGCVSLLQSREQGWTPRVDMRSESSVSNDNRVSDVGGEPLRVYFWRFRMFTRLAAGRALLSPSRSIEDEIPIWRDSSGSTDLDVLRVLNIFALRLKPLLSLIVQHILSFAGTANPSWHSEQFRLAYPLEYCAARLLQRLLHETAASISKELAWLCDLETGPGAAATLREEWRLTLGILRKVVEGQYWAPTSSGKPHRETIRLLVPLAKDALWDMSRESWLTSFEVDSVDWYRKATFAARRARHYSFSVVCRLFVAQWAFGGNVGTISIKNHPGWHEGVAFGIDWIPTSPPDEYLKYLKAMADSIIRLSEAEHDMLSQLDHVHWPQSACASLLIRTIFQNCLFGSARTHTKWFSWHCGDFVKRGKGPWRVTAFLLHRMEAWTCAYRSPQSQIGLFVHGTRFLWNPGHDGERGELLSCLLDLVRQERRLQLAWEDIKLPLKSMSHDPRGSISDRKCLQLAARVTSGRGGNNMVQNPASRVQIHSRCRNKLLEHHLPFDLRLSIRRFRKRWSRYGKRHGHHIVCSSDEHNPDTLEYNQQYVERAADGFCRRPQGMWKNLSLAGPAIRCKYMAIAKLFGFRPGMRVLELGSGCSHHLQQLSQKFGIRGVGVELMQKNSEWARANFQSDLDALCTANVADPIPFLPNNTFHVVISNAVLRELPVNKQCAAVKLAVRYLVPGGCAWFGWLRDYKAILHNAWIHQPLRRSTWWLPGCLRSSVRAGHAWRTKLRQPGTHQQHRKQAYGFSFASVFEKHFFGTVEYEDNVGKGSYSLLLCKNRRQPHRS